MATESTAIVNLLDLVKNQKPLEKDAADDLLFGGRVRFDPMAMPAPAQPVMLPHIPQPFIRQPTPALEARTHRVSRVADPKATLKKFALPVTLFCCVMVLLSVYLATDSKSAPKANVVQMPQPTVEVPLPAAAPSPAPAPAPEAPAPEAAAAATAVVTPIEQPQPTITEIQPTVPTVPEAQPTVPTVPTIADAEPAEEAVAEEAPVAKKSKKSKRKSKTRAAKRSKKETRVAVAEQPKPAAKENLGGKGALQISSSPKREVWIDGRNTKQMTPQTLKLSPGTHNITLFDKKTRSAKTFQVDIKPNQTLRVSKSY